jgi:hypothetical protein
LTNYVKATRAFYHDSVGTRAHNEVFQVNNSEVLSTLEKSGYVKKVDGQEFQEAQAMQEKMGQVQAKTNEAISLAHHAQNQEANQHTQTVNGELRGMAQNVSKHENQTNRTNSARKATEK